MSIMKVIVLRNGEIEREFEVVGFAKGIKAALHLLCIEIERYVSEDKNLAITTCHLSSNEWAASVECADDELFGVHVGRGL